MYFPPPINGLVPLHNPFPPITTASTPEHIWSPQDIEHLKMALTTTNDPVAIAITWFVGSISVADCAKKMAEIYHSFEAPLEPPRPKIATVADFNPYLDVALIQRVQNAPRDSFNWDNIAHQMDSSGSVCKERYCVLISRVSPLDIPWSLNEDAILTKGVQKCGFDWLEISALYFKGLRKADACQSRWNKIKPPLIPFSIPPPIVPPPKIIDKNKLAEVVQTQPLENFSWDEVAKQMGWSAVQCKEKYSEWIRAHAKPAFGLWSEEEDERLKLGVQTGGKDWKEISSVFLKGLRTANDCSSRWMNDRNPRLSKEPWSADDQMGLEACIEEKGFQLKALYEHFEETRSPLLLQEKMEAYREAQKTAPKKRKASQKPDKQPLVKSIGLFTPELDAKLIEIVHAQALETFDWKKVARQLGTFTTETVRERLCFLRSKVIPLTTPWTPAENLLLKQGVERCQAVWEIISALYFKGTRSKEQCQTQWRDEVNPLLKKDPWTEEEQKILTDFFSRPRQGSFVLTQVYKLFGETRGWSFLQTKIQEVKKRKPQKAVLSDEALLEKLLSIEPDIVDWKQLGFSFQVKKKCLERLMALNPRSQEPWSELEKQKLRHAFEKRGEAWEEIAGLYFRGTRSPSDCLTCWKELQNQWTVDILDKISKPIDIADTWESLAQASSLTVEDFKHRCLLALFTFCYKGQKWTEEEDAILQDYLTKNHSSNPDWLLIALRLFPFKRNPTECQTRATHLALMGEKH